jgi:hypothetical protein
MARLGSRSVLHTVAVTKPQQRRYLRLELLPLPEMTRYWQDNNNDLKIMLGYLALVPVVVAVIALAIYFAPLIAGAAASGLSALGAATSDRLPLATVVRHAWSEGTLPRSCASPPPIGKPPDGYLKRPQRCGSPFSELAQQDIRS